LHIRAILLAILLSGTIQTSARADTPRLADDAVAAIQDGMIQWLGTLLRWAGITEFDLVGFRLTPTDDPTIWKGGFLIREEGCSEDRMVDAAWRFIDTEEERAVATNGVVTRRCDGTDRDVTFLIKQGLVFVDSGEVPRYYATSGTYRSDDGSACEHKTTVTLSGDGKIIESLSILNLCDDSTSIFSCSSNWCSGPDLLTHVQITGDDKYTVHRVTRKYTYNRIVEL